MRIAGLAILLPLGLAACQAPSQPQITAEAVCTNAGLNPGSGRYYDCVARVEKQNANPNAVAAGAAAAH